MSGQQGLIPSIGFVNDADVYQNIIPGLGFVTGSPSASQAITLTGPASGAVTVASTNFIVGVNSGSLDRTVVVTPATNISGGGSFSPTFVTLAPGDQVKTFTFTPAKSAAHTITATNDTGGDITDPNPVAYAVAPAIFETMVTSPTDSTPRANLTNLKWAWFDTANPANFVAPTDKGSSETTSGAGGLVIHLPNSTLTNGQVGWLVVTDSDGTPAQNPSGKTGGGPVTVV